MSILKGTTPGDWIHSGRTTSVFANTDRGKLLIATGRDVSNETMANLDLISAAPKLARTNEELMAALSKTLSAYKGDPGVEHDDYYSEVCSGAEAALKRAEE